jgi:biotin carboxyl carrier protein
MKLNAEYNQQQSSIIIKQIGEKLFAEIDSRKYELEAHEIKEGVYLFKHEGRVYECRVDKSEKKQGQFHVHLRNQSFQITIHDPKRLRGSTGEHEHGDGVAEITAPMPGKVVRLLVEEGAEVKTGDGIVVVEAMKMQNEMKSPKDGVVKELRAVAGDTVNGGDVLAIIE